MRKLFLLLPALAMATMLSAPKAQATDVTFACGGISSTPCTGSVSTGTASVGGGTEFSSTGFTVNTATGGGVNYTATFDTGNASTSGGTTTNGTIKLTDV